ncbi:MAG: alpha-galactosidase [Clostridia bacterium]|nr:alpha-galactosidase [Clostridia bacterium]
MKLNENVELLSEMKLVGDAYTGAYTNGLTMTESQTMDNMEKVRNDDEEVAFVNKDNVSLRLLKDNQIDYMRVKSEVSNKSDKPIKIEMLSTFVLKKVKADKVHRLQSFWSQEGKLRTETVTELMLESSYCGHGARIEKFGSVGSLPVRKYFPWLVLENSETHEFIGIQLYCASSWQMELIVKYDDVLMVEVGLADRDYGHWMKELKPGESFTTPEAVIVTGDSMEIVCERLVRAQRPNISPVDEGMPIAFNEYCATWGDPTFESVSKACEKIAGKGFKYFTIDSGWYAAKENWWTRIGDWEINEDRFPGGLKPTCDLVRSHGMIPGIWFELESIGSACKYYDKTEYLLCKDGYPIQVGDRRFWDMENPFVIEYLSEKVIKMLKDNGFGYVKIDYNDDLGIGVDDEEGLGEGLRKRIRATQKFFEKIREEIPDIVIENCASGGHRLEPSMMEICSQASFSDAHETTSIPIIAANLHRCILPSQSQIWAVMRTTDDDNRIIYSIVNTFLGRMCISGDVYDLNDHQWDLIEEGMAFYNKVSHIIDKGMTTRIDTWFGNYNHPEGEQIVIRRYEGQELILFHRFEKSKAMDMSVLEGKKIIASYGKADSDFSAIAYLVEV